MTVRETDGIIGYLLLRFTEATRGKNDYIMTIYAVVIILGQSNIPLHLPRLPLSEERRQ